jgi:lipoprotein-anchoring transpeptidase ErfK/SrfK
VIKRFGIFRVATAVLLLSGTLAGAWLAYAYAQTARIGSAEPGDNGWTNSGEPRIVIDVDNASNLSTYQVLIDGQRVTDRAQLDGNHLVLEGVPLSDGGHVVLLRAHAGGIFGGSIQRSWTIRVDTQAPTLSLRGAPTSGWLRSDTLDLRGRTEPESRLEIKAGPHATTATADGDGRFDVKLGVSDGTLPLTVTVRDRAGNISAKTATLRVDATAPVVELETPKVARRAFPALAGTVTDTTGVVSQKVTLDGKPYELGTELERPLAQGVHRLVVEAADEAGNETKRTARFLVDSTEKFGRASMVKGARGADVKALAGHLKEQGYYTGTLPRVYGARLETAVRNFQEAHYMPADGIAGQDTVGALSTRIIIDQGDHSLTLYRMGKKPVRFGVAVGQSAYPTPYGEFSVIAKVVDPTWTPPNSDWAKGALPIPPGPNNPLGTRWIGISSPGVGIHGTNDPASIGYSVSHGCIRMQISDVEQLFEMVYQGTPVTIRA